jgi:hypothetical protein
MVFHSLSYYFKRLGDYDNVSKYGTNCLHIYTCKYHRKPFQNMEDSAMIGWKGGKIRTKKVRHNFRLNEQLNLI